MTAVSMRGVAKTFGPVRALVGVDFLVEQGEIHALVGENGAGKTTLMRALYGAIRADSGEIEVNSKRVHFKSAAEGIAAGIGMVSQHYSVIGGLSCLENLMLGAEPGAIIDLGSALRKADELANKMGFSFDWNADAESLSPAACQKLEILKLLWRDSRIMILDEPTAMLSPADGDALFGSLKRLAGEGAAVIHVTHRLPEVIEHCDRVTVMRSGQIVGSCRVTETDAVKLAEMIVGRSLELAERRSSAQLDSLLEVENLSVLGDRGDQAVEGIGFTLRRGEILGVAGVDGNGQRELFRAILGVVPTHRGEIRFDGRSVLILAPAERIALGMRLVPEDRHTEGIVDDWPLDLNAAIGLQRLPPFAKGRWVDHRARTAQASAIAGRFKTRHGGLTAPIRSLSGGNQQRFVVGRALALSPKLILAYQPARGLDIEATEAIYSALRAEAVSGAGSLVVSYDLDELLEYCDRIVVLRGGRLFEPAPGLERDRAQIGRLMVGAA